MEQVQPRHLRNLSLPFIGTIILIFWLGNGPWWEVALLLFGMELFDLGWHSSAHHRGFWLAHPIVRIAGCVMALAATILMVYFK